MQCSVCDTPVPDHSRYCLNCGSQVSDPEMQAAATHAMQESSERRMEALLREDTAGEFEIGEPLGRGGMAMVYLATEVHLSRKVAIKVLPPELTFGQGVERFMREARTAAALDHPHIIPIHRIASSGAIFWYAMKYLEGRSLDELLREKGKFSLEETIRILEPIADALDYAHEHGVIHRDIKPANVMLDAQGRVVVTDFGIAKPLSEGTLTASGSVVGTPYYMSPEQGTGQTVSAASDQYSLAVMAYEMLSGKRPFEGGSAIDILHKHVKEDPPSLRDVQVGLPDHVYDAVHRALSKATDQRFESARALVAALERPAPDSALTLAAASAAAATVAAAPAAPPLPVSAPAPATAPSRPSQRAAWLILVMAVAVAGIWWFWLGSDPVPRNQVIASGGNQAGDSSAAAAAGGVPVVPGSESATGAPTGTESDSGVSPAPALTPTPAPEPSPPPATPEEPAPRLDARVVVTGLPSGGALRVDGRRPTGDTDFALAPGRHVIAFVARGFVPYADTITVQAGETVRIRFGGRPVAERPSPPQPPADSTPPPPGRDPEPSPAARTGPPAVLAIRTMGGWAQVSVDSTLLGTARLFTDTLPAGTHLIQVRRAGFADVDTTITLQPGERRIITIPLRRN